MTTKPTNETYTTVDASPVKSFFVSMLTRDITLEDAILDLLDNCVDGILRQKPEGGSQPYAGYKATIEFNRDTFTISDNCGGIPWSLHEYAFRILGDAVRDRLAAQRALASRFSTPRAAVRALGKIASRVEARGDLATLGVVTNTLGVLYRRIGEIRAAAALHRRAIGLASVSGDYRTVQAAIFNLALCRYRVRKDAGLPPDEHMIHLAELCERVANRFGVGNDSAQAPSTAALWASQLGKCSDAQRHLRSAEALIEKIASTWEQGYFHEVRARIARNCPSPGVDPSRDFRTAAILFEKAGDTAAARRARQRVRQPTSPT
jgi:hypothetical protein